MSADLELYAVPANDEEAIKAWWDYDHISIIGDEDEGQSRADMDASVREFDGPDYRSASWDEHSVLTARVRGYRLEPGERPDDPFREWVPLDGKDGYPHIWVGQFSSMKAGLMDDVRWIPGPVAAVVQVLKRHNLMTPQLRGSIMAAMNQPNDSYYGRRKYVPNVREMSMYEGEPFLRYASATRISHSPVGFYKGGRGIQRRQKLRRWCDENMGRRIFWCGE